jgi:hypothetical protein
MTTQRALTEEAVEGELKELRSRVHILNVVSTVVALGGLAIGALAAIELGPSPFLAGAVIGGVAALVTRVYAMSRKNRLREEISSLQENGEITKDEATELTTRVNVIYTDDPRNVSHS